MRTKQYLRDLRGLTPSRVTGCDGLSMPKVSFKLNGKPVTASYEPGMHFLEVLREECGIVSAKDGCAPEGTCGCCTILVDGRPVLACLRKPEQMEGHEVVTLEGVSAQMRQVLGEAFLLEGGVQCGFCIPGIVVRACPLVAEGRTDDREAVARRCRAIFAGARATDESSTPFKRRARPGRTTVDFPAINRGGISFLARNSD